MTRRLGDLTKNCADERDADQAKSRAALRETARDPGRATQRSVKGAACRHQSYLDVGTTGLRLELDRRDAQD